MSYVSRIAMRAAAPAAVGAAPSTGGAGGKGHARPSLRSESPLALADQRLNMPELASVLELGFGDGFHGDEAETIEVVDIEAATERYGGFDIGPTPSPSLDAPAAPAPATVRPSDVGSSVEQPGASPGEPSASPRYERRVEVISQVMPSPSMVTEPPSTPSRSSSADEPLRPSNGTELGETVLDSTTRLAALEGIPASLAAALSRARAWIEQPATTVEPRRSEYSSVRAELPVPAPAPVESDAVDPPAVGLHIGSIHVEVVPPSPSHVAHARERAAQPARRTTSRERQTSWAEPRTFGWRQR